MKKSLLLSTALIAAASAFAQDFDVYVIGSDVNGSVWACGKEDAKMTFNDATGVYEWDGQFLGTGFKFNDGTWDNDAHNWGAGETLELGKTYNCVVGGSSGNINFEGFTGVNNPHVVFDAAAGTCVVTGEATGVIQWFLTGDFNNWAITEDAENACVLTKVGETSYMYEGVEFFGDGAFKVASSGWGTQYGTYTDLMFGLGLDAGTLELVGSDGAVPVFYYGVYDMTCTMEVVDGKKICDVAFTVSGSSVKSFQQLEEGATYFNLQGQKVENPSNGIFVKVSGGKASKVAVR